MDDHYQRARFFHDQGRHAEALAELQAAETSSPDNPFVHGLRVMCLLKLDRLQQAEEAARRCVEIAPDLDYSHYVMADALLHRRQFKESRNAALNAVRLGPEDSMNHGLLARVEAHFSNWEATLAAADAGLQLDASDDGCRHWRAHALRQLGRGAEADQEVELLLAENPDDPHTHDAKGWFLLDEGRPAEARTHFLEALRLLPGLESSRLGFANSLKSRHVVFCWLLRLLLWLNRFRTWAIAVGAIAVFLTLSVGDKWVRSHPEQYAWVTIAKFSVWTVVIGLVVAQPLFDMVLRFDPEGRNVLTPRQRQASLWCGLCFLWALAFMALWAWKGGRMLPTYALCAVMLSSPITNLAEASSDWVRVRMKWLTILAALIIPFAWLMPVVLLVLAIKFKYVSPGLIKVMIYLPLVSLLISSFSDDILNFLEKRRPDVK